MPKVSLSATSCMMAECQPGRKRTDYYDTTVTGFVLEVHASGAKTYTFRFQDQYGRQSQRKIASYGDITFAQAQQLAKRFRAEVTMGGDPAVRKADKRAVPSYAELADQHLAFAKTYQKRPSNTESILRTHINPKWAKKRVDEIASPAIAEWLANLRQSGLAFSTVDKIRIVFNRSFELALKWQTKGVHHNPVRGIPRPKYNNARDRFLSSEEAARLLKACEVSANPQLRNIVALLLLTGARKRELLDATWENINLERKVWYIPTSKTGKARHVPLSKPAVEIIEKLPKFKDCPWLLPNPKSKKKTPYADIKHPWETARDLAGLSGLHLHDLRHSAASFMVNAGIDLFAVGRILGHVDHQSTMRYSHLANETLMEAVEAGAAKLNLCLDSSNPT